MKKETNSSESHFPPPHLQAAEFICRIFNMQYYFQKSLRLEMQILLIQWRLIFPPPPIYRQRGILRCIFNVHYITKYEGGKIMLLKWQLNNACLFPDFSFKNDILKKFGCRSAVSLIQTKKLMFFKTSSRVGVKT